MNDSSAPPEGARRWLRWGWLLSGLLAVVLFLPSLAFDFTYDDLPIVRDNRRIRDLSRPELYLGTSYWNRPGMHKEYRPVTMLSYALNYAVAKDAPQPHHAVNVILHALVTVAVWWLIFLLFKRPGLATLATLLFALHPIHVESVAGVVGRAELLSSLGFLIAFCLAFLSFRTASPAARWGIASLAGLIALIGFGSKENALMLPAALLLIPLVARGRARADSDPNRIPFPSFGRLIPALAFTALAAVIYLLARRGVLGGFLAAPGQSPISPVDNPLLSHGGFLRLISALKVQAVYLLMLIAPFNPSPDYSLGAVPLVTRVSDPTWIFGALLGPLLLWVAWLLRRRPASLFGIAFFIITFIITSNIFFPIGVMLAERLLYLPSIGFCILIADLALLIYERLGLAGLRGSPGEPPHSRYRKALPWIAIAAAFLWVLALVIQTERYLPKWKDQLTLANYMVERVPGSVRGHHLLGQELLALDRPEEAIAPLQKSVELQPKLPALLSTLGSAYRRTGRVDEAKTTLAQALRYDPDDARAILNLAPLYLETGEAARAEPLFPSAIAAQPDNYELRRGYGLVLASVGKIEQAIAQLERILPPDGTPNDLPVVWTLGRAYLEQENYARAAEFLRKTIAADPGLGEARLHLADALMNLGRLREAEAVLLDAIDRDPSNDRANPMLNAIRAMIEPEEQQ